MISNLNITYQDLDALQDDIGNFSYRFYLLKLRTQAENWVRKFRKYSNSVTNSFVDIGRLKLGVLSGLYFR